MKGGQGQGMVEGEDVGRDRGEKTEGRRLEETGSRLLID
jgi:hypothetical protein